MLREVMIGDVRELVLPSFAPDLSHCNGELRAALVANESHLLVYAEMEKGYRGALRLA